MIGRYEMKTKQWCESDNCDCFLLEKVKAMAAELQDDTMLMELDEEYKEYVKQVMNDMEVLKTTPPKQIRSEIERVKTGLKECGIKVCVGGLL